MILGHDSFRLVRDTTGLHSHVPRQRIRERVGQVVNGGPRLGSPQRIVIRGNVEPVLERMPLTARRSGRCKGDGRIRGPVA